MESDHYQQVPNAEPPRSCIFLGDPFPDCFCVNLTSRHIARMVSYCAGAFESCPVYGRARAIGAGRKPEPESPLGAADDSKGRRDRGEPIP